MFSVDGLRRVWSYLAATDPAWVILWTGLALLAAALGVLLWTRWGQSRPLEKCLLLSLLAHVWIAVLSMTIQFAVGAPGLDEVETLVTLDDPLPDGPNSTTAVRKADRAADGTGDGREGSSLRVELPRAETNPAVATQDAPRQPIPAMPPPEPPPTPAKPAAKAPPVEETAERALEAIRPATPRPQDGWAGDTPPQVALPDAKPFRDAAAARVATPRGKAPWLPTAEPSTDAVVPPEAVVVPVGSDATPRTDPAGTAGPVPELYRLRTASDHSQQARRAGANAESERAVQAALAWITHQQEPDGRWSAVKHGGGVERMENGLDRQGAGRNADTGVSGLALLAFAAAGNTHRTGPHRAAVARGVNYLLRMQGSDGALGGQAEVYEFTYCHGMATLALAELLGMSGDSSLREPVARAVRHTLAAQDRHGGGWRYRAGQPGDTSQLGWQLMALKSAALAGVKVPESTWNGIDRFLQSVSAGDAGGLAAYRPGERVSRTMTAEALVCRLFRGASTEDAASREAADYLLGQLPNESEPNLYYWYYATLAMHQMQGDDWRRWSESMEPTLLARQVREGLYAGSWEPSGRWDGYGGRVYSTALATLCLETYYRFLPLVALRPRTGERLQR